MNTRSSDTLGVVGLGVMGAPMCANLLKQAGRPMEVHGTAAAAVEDAVAQGAAAAQVTVNAFSAPVCVAPGNMVLAISTACEAQRLEPDGNGLPRRRRTRGMRCRATDGRDPGRRRHWKRHCLRGCRASVRASASDARAWPRVRNGIPALTSVTNMQRRAGRAAVSSRHLADDGQQVFLVRGRGARLPWEIPV